MPWDSPFWNETLQRILADILTWLPALGGALLLLVAGWILARLIQAVLAGLLRRLGFNRLAERVGFSRSLRDLGMEAGPAELIARLVYWVVLLVFVLAAAESLGMRGVTETLGGLVGYLPRVIAAALILLLGSLIARLVGNALGTLAEQSGVRGGLALGQGARYVVLAFAAVLALEQLGVATTLLVTTATAVIASAVFALAVAFGWGSRDLARNIMAGIHAREEFTVGQRITVRGHTGRLALIGPVKTVLETGAGRVSLPNAALTDEEVVVLPEEPHEQ